MTYGWAILVVLIVLAALFYLGVFDSKSDVKGGVEGPFTYDLKVGQNGVEVSINTPSVIKSATIESIKIDGTSCSNPYPTTLVSGTKTLVRCTGVDLTNVKTANVEIGLTYIQQNSQLPHTINIEETNSVEDETITSVADGECGSAINTPVETAPSTNLCSVGSASGVSEISNEFRWTCTGTNPLSGTNVASCSVGKKVNGVCGSANGQTLPSAPTTNLCVSPSTPTAVTGTGPWNWNCVGINTGTTASCIAYKSSIVCGNAICDTGESSTKCPVDCRTNIVGHWTFNTGNANAAYGGFTGTVTGATYSATSGVKSSGGYTFNSASNNYIKVSDNVALQPIPTVISFGGWIKINGDGSYFDGGGNYILSKGRIGSQPYMSYGLLYNPGGGTNPAIDKLGCEIGFNPGTQIIVYSSSTYVPSQNWIHVICTYDGSSLKIYVNNGVPVSTSNTNGIKYDLSAFISETQNDDLHFGHWGYGSYTRAFNGIIDEILIYNKALTQGEVSELYQYYQ